MCPLCHSKRVRRSAPKLWDFIFVILRARPMRCRVCSYRYYRWPWSSSEPRTYLWRPARPVDEVPQLKAFVPLNRPAARAAAASQSKR
jgi:hypothetical protein